MGYFPPSTMRTQTRTSESSTSPSASSTVHGAARETSCISGANDITFSLLQDADVKSAALTFGRVFLQGEEIARRNGLTLPDFEPFTNAFCRLCARQGLSYVAKYRGEVVGFMLCEPASPEATQDADEEMLKLMHEVETSLPRALVPVFAMIEHCQRLMHENMKDADDNILHMVAIGVLPAFAGRNISGLLSLYACTNALKKRVHGNGI